MEVLYQNPLQSGGDFEFTPLENAFRQSIFDGGKRASLITNREPLLVC